MPDGFVGNPAATYLGEVETAHNQALTVATQPLPAANSPRSPAAIPPNLTPLPYPAATARSGSHTTGYGSSDNIVSAADQYAVASQKLIQADDMINELLYHTAMDIADMCQTIFILPAANAQILNLTNNIQSAVRGSRAIADSATSTMRSFASSIASVG